MLSEINYTKTNTVWSHLNVKSKKERELRDTENVLVVVKEDGEWVKWINGVKSYKHAVINKC